MCFPSKPQNLVTAVFALVFVICPPLLAQEAAPSPSPLPLPATAVPTPIPLSKVPSEFESALALLQQIEESRSRDSASLKTTSDALSNFTTEIEARVSEDARILAGNPSLDLLYRLRTAWQTFADSLSKSQQDLAQRASTLDEQIARLAQLSRVWQVTVQAGAQKAMPPAVLQKGQDLVDRIVRAQQAAESDRAQVLTLQTGLSSDDTRINTAGALIARVQNETLKDMFSRDSPPIWDTAGTLTSEWRTQSGETFSSQWDATIAFSQRLPFSFALHAVCILFLAIFIRWLRRRVSNAAEVNPALRRAVPILDLPISTAFVLSLVLIPSVYLQAPRWIQAVMGAMALVPTVVILRRLLERNLFPLLYALVGLYFITQLRLLAASLPVLARFFSLLETLGGFLFLVWLFRTGKLAAAGAETTQRFSQALQLIVKIGLVVFPTSLLANILGYINLANLLAIVYVRSIFLAALLYVVIRVLEGFIVIALQVRPLGALRAVQRHREMLHRRTCYVLEFLAFLFWLELMLNFFGLRQPLLAEIGELLNANVALGSLNVSLGRILAFAIAVWASFLISKFLRFFLEEGVYHHLHLERGIPYAISTMLHYSLLLIGFFVALGALGIDLTKITILAGAFSVGVGFGLQNVINNFVSGLILLFERPIKIGDVIEIGGNVGEVRRIGIRACVIRTGDGSEIIVPNGTLISNQVTNWTFSDRARSVEISVNLVTGTDSQKVFELLKTVAANQPGIAKEPEPQVYVVNFSAGSMTFQLRAWTDRYQDWTQVRSDLAVAINEALAREKMGIA